MRSTAGISTSALRGDGAHDETQPAPDSPNPALPGPVADAPSAARDAASRQDATKTADTLATTFEEIEGAVGRGYYVVRAAIGPDFRREWWLSYSEVSGGWQCSEFLSLPPRFGAADEFRS